MRLVIARCTVDYDGRLTAHLPSAVRLIMVKADGCVAIHADGGAYKPLNWMNAPNRLVEDDGVWVVTNPKGEQLTITLDEVLADTAHEMGVDPGLQKDGVEAHLQEAGRTGGCGHVVLLGGHVKELYPSSEANARVGGRQASLSGHLGLLELFETALDQPRGPRGRAGLAGCPCAA